MADEPQPKPETPITDPPTSAEVNWADFLANFPADAGVEIRNLCVKQHYAGGAAHWVSNKPDVKLHCEVRRPALL